MRAAFHATVSPTALRALNYAPEVEAFKRAGARRRSVALGSLSAAFGVAYRRIFTRQECDPKYGVELLGQSDMFATEPVGRWIREDGIRCVDDQRIKPGQLLFAGVGTLGETELYGRCILADQRLEGRIIGSDAVALTFKAPGSDIAAFTYAFLCTRAGVRAVRATGYGTKLMSLRMDFLRALPIPLGTDEQIARVAALIRTTVEQREAYAQHIRETRALLEKIPGFSDGTRSSEGRSARHLHWQGPLVTLSAWNYAFAGEALKVLRAVWSHRLLDMLRPEGLSSGDRSVRIACEPPHGIDFASQRDVFMIRRFPRRIAAPSQGGEKLLADAETVLIACDGQAGEGTLLGRAELAACGLTTTAITEHILRAPLRKEHRWVYALLSSPLGRQLLQSCAVGTSIPKLRMDLVAQLPIPEPSAALVTAINGVVDKVVTARVQADEAEAEAVRILEQEVLPVWLA